MKYCFQNEFHGNDYRVATISKLYPTVTGVIRPSMKSGENSSMFTSLY